MANRQAAGNHKIACVAILLLFYCLCVSIYPSFLKNCNNASGSEAVATPRTWYNTAAVADEFDLAASQSYGFFDDVPAKSWNLYRDIYLKSQNHKDPMNPMDGSQIIVNVTPAWMSIPATWYQNNYEPNFSCAFEKRIGGENTNGDGPKWVCDPHRIKKLALERVARDPNNRGCVVYSIGSNGDFNFELGMQKEIGEGICEYHIFDMGDFSHIMPKNLKRAHYHQWGLERQDPDIDVPVPGKKFYGLRDTIRLLGHEDLDVIDVFKIDCESCEWDTYMDWIAEGIPLLHQIQVETHGVPIEKALGFFDTLEAAGYLRYHKEANILVAAPWAAFGQCFEYGMVKVCSPARCHFF
ncbi:hypothetical protein ACHAW5_008035 [Stephanodiscus triporus]|uniref:Methyltransferase domain-containing protein n=1 Tax=Stephanodiscus triporus TaxID=2934178 RepID=A0ABD3NBF2_9STRA